MAKYQMTFTGIADEAGQNIDAQIRAHKTLGWKAIEIRNVDGQQFTDIPDATFDAVCGKLADAGMKVSSFASGIANWACKISDPFEKSVETLRRSISRMNKLGTKYIRVMSYPNDGRPEDAWREETVRRMKELGRMAADGGIMLLVENCDGWASTSAANYRRFFELVDSPAVRAVYDTGNPAAHGHTNTWEWYELARPYIVYMHIKANTGSQGGKHGEHVWPDSGASLVAETLKDLMKTGFRGYVSIEPHMKAVVHEGKTITDAEAAFLTYVEYGQRLMRMVEGLKAAK